MKHLKYYLIAFGLAGGVVLGANGAAMAWGHGHGGYQQRGLTSEQYAQAEAIRNEYQDTLSSLYSQMDAKQGELKALYDSGNRDEAKAQALFREMGEIKGQIYNVSTEMRAKMVDRGLPGNNMGHGYYRNQDMASGSGWHGHGHGGRHGYMQTNFNGYGRHQGGHW